MAGALPDGEEEKWRVFHDLMQTVGSVLVAVSVGGGLVRRLQEREWRALTIEQAYDLLKQAMFQAALLAERLLHVLGSPDLISELDRLYRLPYEEAQRLSAEDMKDALRPQLVAILNERDEGASTRGRDAAAELELRADKLRELGLELGPYLADDPIGLANRTVRLHRRVRDLLLAQALSPKPDAMIVALAAWQSLSTSIEVAAMVGAEYTKLRQQPIRDEDLRKEIEDDEALSRRLNRTQLRTRNVLEEADRRIEEMEQTVRKAQETEATLRDKAVSS